MMIAPKINLALDDELLSFFNQPGTPWLDAIMRAASSRVLLLVVALAAAIYLVRRSPHGWLAAAMLVLAIGLADLGAVRLVKPLVARDRPCRAERHVTPVDGCGSGESFPSAHASNTAAAATILAWGAPIAAPVAVLITILVGISRIYLGQHYPTDVLAGWLFGVLVGSALVFLSRLRYAVRAG